MNIEDKTVVRSAFVIPLSVIVSLLVLGVSLAGTYAQSQAQIAILMESSLRHEHAITRIQEDIAGIDVLNEKLDTLIKYVDRLDRRAAQMDELKLR